VIATPILLGLFFTDAINIKQYAAMMLVAPPPPPPPPPASGPLIKAAAAHPRFITGGKLFAPTIIPKQVAEIKEEPIEPDSFAGLAGGVPGGVPGGQMGGVIGGVFGTAAPKPLPPMPGKSAPVRVGRRVRLPKAVVQIRPEYPPLARQARIQGQVQIDAVLDEQGNVIEMKVVSGPPLLYQSAARCSEEMEVRADLPERSADCRPDDCDHYLCARRIRKASTDRFRRRGWSIAVRLTPPFAFSPASSRD
jgi:periplasmic protein TonB